MPRDRPRLWESFKRALGGSSPSSEREPEISGPPDYSPPFLAPDEPLPAVEPTPLRATAEPIAPAAEPSAAKGIEEILPDPPEPRSKPVPSPPAADVVAPGSPRLARGLASFSRTNADREKKFRHILSDGDGRTKKKKP